MIILSFYDFLNSMWRPDWKAILLEDTHYIMSVIESIWTTPGVSEFLSALLGGGVTMAAQFLALRHDRVKEAQRQVNEDKARSWAIYFKISQACEALTATAKDIQQHRSTADANNLELWQTFQFPPHDWDTVTWEIEELVLLIDNQHFDLMQRYQEVIWWLSNLVQSVKLYRDKRIEFLTRTPSEVSGDSGTFEVTSQNHNTLMPTIAHLKSIAESLEVVILKQSPDARELLVDYANAMKGMIGMSPKIEFLDEL